MKLHLSHMKAGLPYAENAPNGNEDKSPLLGRVWNLEIPRHGRSVFLVLKKAADGGSLATYEIERRVLPEGDWGLVSVALDSEAPLTGQDRAVEWEDRLIAVNKASEGMPSGTVAEVLSASRSHLAATVLRGDADGATQLIIPAV